MPLYKSSWSTPSCTVMPAPRVKVTFPYTPHTYIWFQCFSCIPKLNLESGHDYSTWYHMTNHLHVLSIFHSAVPQSHVACNVIPWCFNMVWTIGMQVNPSHSDDAEGRNISGRWVTTISPTTGTSGHLMSTLCALPLTTNTTSSQQ